MRALESVGVVDWKPLHRTICLLSFLLALAAPSFPQTASRKRVETDKVNLALNSTEAERRAFAISRVISLATDAVSYKDLTLRPRVLARAADVLWDADNVTARALFARAWQAAEAGDAEGATINRKDNPPAVVTALRKMNGRDLRVEVLSLASGRDKELGEQFLAKLQSETEREAREARTTASSRNVFSGSEASLKRLIVASKLLAEGQVGPAREFAAPALGEVNARSIGFLCQLREKDPAGADQIFSELLTRVEQDPIADANTISGLSSYAFTPGFYIVFWPDGHSTWNQPDGPTITPNLVPSLRDLFFRVAASVLLRPMPPDQDSTSSGRRGRSKVITRLLPLFDLYAPQSAVALRTQLSANATRNIDSEDPLLIEGIRPERKEAETLEGFQEQLDHARSSAERDQIYAAAAVGLAPTGNRRARELADSVNDGKLRGEVRQYVDLELIKVAIRNKDAQQIAQWARSGELTHLQRTWAYTQAARLLQELKDDRALDLLREATDEAERIDDGDSDRPFALIAVANQMLTADRTLAWDLFTETVKAANSTEDFPADDIRMPKRAMLVTRRGTKFIHLPDADFNFSRVLRSLAEEDLIRSVELAKSFKYEATRANATLAIAKAILEKPTPASAKN